MLYLNYKDYPNNSRNQCLAEEKRIACMKKVLKFSVYPLSFLISVAVNAALMAISSVVAVSFMQAASILIYIFLCGIILSKMDDKKIRISSLIFTTILVLAGGIACALAMHNFGDSAVWAGMIIFPFSAVITALFLQVNYSGVLYLVVFAVSSVLPILISYLASLVFKLKKKKLKSVLITIMVFVCIAFSVGGITKIIDIAADSVYKNGEFYNAYYDMNGNKYASNEEVPYYDRDGNVYYLTYNHPVEKYSDEWYTYVGEMTDKNGNEYDVSDFYVYADGYIFMDKDKSIKMRNDLTENVITDWTYVDKNGNICGQVLGVSYNRDGEPYFGMGNEYKNK